MGFRSVENNGGLIAEGDYEAICLFAREGETKGGYPVIKFDFKIRTDVEQKYQNKHVFKNFYKDDSTGEWPLDKIGKYANSMGIPKDELFELSDLEGKCLILHMKPYKGQDGVERDSIFWTAPTKAGQIETVSPVREDGFIQVDSDEVPWDFV